MWPLLETQGLCQQWSNRRRPVLWPIAAAFWSLTKFICRPSTINNPSCDSTVWINNPSCDSTVWINNPSCDSTVWINLPLRRSLLPYEENEIKIPKPSDQCKLNGISLFAPQ